MSTKSIVSESTPAVNTPGSVSWFDNGEPGGEYIATSALVGLSGREWFGSTPERARQKRDDAETVYMRGLERDTRAMKAYEEQYVTGPQFDPAAES